MGSNLRPSDLFNNIPINNSFNASHLSIMSSPGMKFHSVILLLIYATSSIAFTTPVSHSQRRFDISHDSTFLNKISTCNEKVIHKNLLYSSRKYGKNELSNIDADNDIEKNHQQLKKTIFNKKKLQKWRRLSTMTLAFFTSSFLATDHKSINFKNKPPNVSAMGPNLLHKNPSQTVFKGPEKVEQEIAQRVRTERFAKEFKESQEEGNRIRQEEGEEAYMEYSAKRAKEKKASFAKKRKDRRELLKRLLFEENLDPYRSVKGRAILFHFDYGVDLYQETGSLQEMTARMQKINPREIYEMEQVEKKQTIQMIDMMREKGFTDNEILENFKTGGDRKLSRQESWDRGDELDDEEEVETEASSEDVKIDKDAAKEKEKQEKLNLKEQKKLEMIKAKEEKKALKEQKKLEAIKAKEEAQRLKTEAKEKKIAAAAAAAAASAAASVAAATGAATDAITGDAFGSPAVITESNTPENEISIEGSDINTIENTPKENTPTENRPTENTPASTSLKKKTPIIPAATVVGVIGAGGFAFKYMKDKAEIDDEESRRQFNLIMGLEEDDDESDSLSSPSTFISLEDDPITTPDLTTNISSDPVSAAPEIAIPSKGTRKKKGIGSIFSKKSANSRETDITNLLTEDAVAPNFSLVLAKVLTFGAPGRFPKVANLPSPFGYVIPTSYNLDEATEIIKQAREEAGLTDALAAELFASVVNCMLIDIVDLASSTLNFKGDEKEKDKKTMDALNVVLDFMDHAAAVFDVVAQDVTITPVTYGGSLSKSKLEKLFGIYSGSLMSSLMSDDSATTEERVDILQQVFNIKEKKAQGIAQKIMMKNLMSAMKDGEGDGMEGLAEMMGGLGGMEGGMPGFDDPNQEPTPEEIKQSVAMMKELVESGQISKEEVALVKKQFQEAYGADIEDLISAADSGEMGDELGDDGKELLDLFKTVLDEDK